MGVDVQPLHLALWLSIHPFCKLHGWFYQLRLSTDRPRFWRSWTATTEMVNARGFVWLDEHEAEHPDRLWGVRDEPRPLAVQIWDNDPEIMAKVGRRLVEEYQVSVVDINFGCPVKQVTQRALGFIPPEISGPHVPDHSPIGPGLFANASNGQDPVGLHSKMCQSVGGGLCGGRGRSFGPDRPWPIRRTVFQGQRRLAPNICAKDHLKSIPLIGNGDLDSPEKVLFAFRNYRIDGVMIARAALGRPWLFAQAAAAVRGQPIPPDPSLEEQRQCMLRHFELVTKRFGQQKGTLLMRKYACCYAQGMPGARHFRSNIAHVATPEQFSRSSSETFQVKCRELSASNRPAVIYDGGSKAVVIEGILCLAEGIHVVRYFKWIARCIGITRIEIIPIVRCRSSRCGFRARTAIARFGNF